MAYRGHIIKGQVILDEPAYVPDGTPVIVDIAELDAQKKSAPSSDGKTIWDGLLELAGTAEGLPPDFAEEHDHYIHGTPKKNRPK